ncbi:MAG: aminotransferase class V-fold PLP-dependent enzyme [Proteobacteria bacterium]|nr:aminotransferase class V-fold PLP-dependent enzyme [Pseudomonadota bacterium]MBI3499153.1 aminotransferase class V-fold PLP-dependent enzyme [Pseudomonadota bacterium]
MTAKLKPRSDVRTRMGLRPIINVSGTMTHLGASIVVPDAVRTVAEILPEFVEINDLHRKASRAIAKLTGAEAGFVTASASAGITLSVAGCMTGPDLALIEQLPDAAGMKDEVVIQMGHMTQYGAPIEQAIRLAGAKVVPVGTVTDARPYQLAHKLGERTAAAVYVVSHHTVQYGMIPLAEFASICHEKGVPVVADLASEYDLKGFLAAGTDLAVYSAHKFLGAPTAGIVAGPKVLVRSVFLQNAGIGRGMKVGKEGIAGTIAALEAWAVRDHAGVRKIEAGYLQLWVKRFQGLPGIEARIIPDPTNNPLDRLMLKIDPEMARITAWELADALASGDPPVIVRDHEVEHGFFQMDPCNLHQGEAEIVADRVVAELKRAATRNRAEPASIVERKKRRFQRLLAWPD